MSGLTAPPLICISRASKILKMTKRRDANETYISAKPPEARQNTRFPLAHVDKERPQGPRTAPCKGSQEPVSLSLTASSDARGEPRPQNQDTKLVRLRVRSQFLFVRNGQSERRRSVVVQARPNSKTPQHIGVGFTATKKVGNAVIRNRSKRRLREAARLLLPQHGLTSCDYVFIARHSTAEIDWQRLLDDVESALISLAASFSSGSD